MEKTVRINELLQNRCKSKFQRDGLDVVKAIAISCKVLETIRNVKSGMNNSCNNILKEEMLKDIEIPSQDPIILTDNPIFQNDTFKSLCAKGPSFVPTPQTVNWSQLQMDFENFQNMVRREIFFAKTPAAVNVANTEDGPPHKPSNWKAPKTNIVDAEMFLKCIERDLFSDTSHKKVRSNLTKEENEMISYCKNQVLFNKDSEQVLRLQDKGSKFVVVDKVTELMKVETQIVSSSMEKVDNDPTQLMINRVSNWCVKWEGNGYLSKEWASFIVNKDAKPAKNKPLYKTHKNDIPVRLLTSGNGSATENLSLYVEKKCSVLAQSLKSRIKDTGHMLSIIDEINNKGLPSEALLVSLDVENMFPSIDNNRGLETLKKKLDRRVIKSPPTECLVEALEIILTSNNSVFNKEHLIQTNGTATGSKNSCSYSDLALEPIDEHIYQAQNSMFSEVLTYYRFRDDCFLIWNGPTHLINHFVYFVNILDPSLRFTVNIGGKSLKFMDILITIENGKLETTVYSKPTDGHLYLHQSSCHPVATKLAVEKGVALRLKRLCSLENEFDRKSKEYQAFLVSRGHDPINIIENFEQVKNVSRNEARKKQSKQEGKKKKRFFTEYNPRSPNISQIIKKHEHFIRNHELLNKLFPNNCFQVVSRRGKNLKELITRADPYNVRTLDIDYSYHKCGMCDSCRNFVFGNSKIKSFATGRIFQIRKNMNCNTPNVIYAAECSKCSKQGVGSTVKWKPRLSNYKAHIKAKKKTCRIVKHFMEECFDNDPCKYIRFHIIDSLDNVDGFSDEKIDELLLEKEKMWIRNLVTVHKGMNSHHDLNRRKRCDREVLD